MNAVRSCDTLTLLCVVLLVGAPSYSICRFCLDVVVAMQAVFSEVVAQIHDVGDERDLRTLKWVQWRLFDAFQGLPSSECRCRYCFRFIAASIP